MSTGIPLSELIEAVKAEAGFGEKAAAQTLEKKVYYEFDMEGLVKEAGKENLQTKKVSISGLTEAGKETVIIGCAGGGTMFSVGELESEYGYNREEAEKAQGFLRSVRLGGATGTSAIPLFLQEAVMRNSGKTAESLR